MSERRTIYESAAGRRRRRLRAAKLAALVAVLALAAAAVAAAFALRDGSGRPRGSRERRAVLGAVTGTGAAGPAGRRRGAPRRQGDDPVPRRRRRGDDGGDPRRPRRRRAAGQGPAPDGAARARRETRGGRSDRPPAGPLHLRAAARGTRVVASPSPSAAAQASDGVASAALVVRKPLPPGFPGKKRRRGGHGVDLGPRRRRRLRGRRHQRRGRRRPPAARALPARQPLQGHPAGRLPARRPDAGRGDRGDAHEDDHRVRQRRRVHDLRAGRRQGHARGGQGRRHGGLRAGLRLDRHAGLRPRPGALLLAARVPRAAQGARLARASCSRA